MTEIIETAFNTCYRWLFNEKPTAGPKKFFKNLGIIGICFATAKALTGLANIAAGRLLGPHEYGKVNLIISVGAILSPFLLMGINYSIVKYGASNKNPKSIISTAFGFFIPCALTISFFIFYFRTELGSFFGITSTLLIFALFYAITVSFFNVISSVQQALNKFNQRGFSEISFAFLFLISFAAGILLFGKKFETIVYAYIIAFGSVSIFFILKLNSFIKPQCFDKKRLPELTHYGIYFLGSGIGSFFIFNVQSLIINTYLSPKEVGIYAAYYIGTIGIAGYISYAIYTVLFPKSSGSTNRKRLWDLSIKFAKRLLPLIFIFFVFIEIAVLTLMGKSQYGMNATLIITFALCGILMLIQSSLTQIILAQGIKASRLALFMSLSAGLLNFILCILLIPHLKILATTISFIITYSFLIIWLWKVKNSYLQMQAHDMPSSGI